MSLTAPDVVLILGGVGVLATQIAALVVSVRNGTRIDVVRETVNGHSTKQDERISELTAALTASGTEVPRRPFDRRDDR